MLLLYSSQITARLQYIVGTLLQDIGGIEVSFTSIADEFNAYDGAKINYSFQQIADDEFFITPGSDILFEKTIKTQDVTVETNRNYIVLFPTVQGDLSFDIFAASFFLLTRYEEYLPHQKDEYGRFAHVESIAYKNAFLDQPLINSWLEDFRKTLQARFPFLLFALKKFRFIPTYDIDIAFSYLHKGILRNTGGAVKSILKGELASVKNRVEVITKQKDDPFDTYEWLYALHLKYQLHPYYFFLLAKSPGLYDKNIDPQNPEMQELIRYHALGYNVGIHPSWQSGDQKKLLPEEIKTMEAIIGRSVVNSRQHYIRMSLPDSYQQLIDLGIHNEFSMGYGSINGFRASIASPFYWYDLSAEQKTSLLVFPFCFMDANSYYEQKFTPYQAFNEIRYYHDTIKKVNGTMITIWHNNFFGTDKMFEGWKEVYELFLEEVVYWDF
ncbi:MAG: polysaccharide deacetylase family protein [Agriterribacter sp.]